jgi:hypothetical protein
VPPITHNPTPTPSRKRLVRCRAVRIDGREDVSRRIRGLNPVERVAVIEEFRARLCVVGAKAGPNLRMSDLPDGVHPALYWPLS